MDHSLDLSGTRVLVAEDTSMMRVMHKKYLLELGFLQKNIFIADDGHHALTILERLKTSNAVPTLIISDFDMPKVNGLELLQKIKSDEATKGVIFVMVTGHTDAEELKHILVGGVDGVIIKPFKPELYNKKVIELLGKKIMSGK